jgi:hypothetical protein
MDKLFVYCLLFVFGAAIMALEMLAPRMMAPYFGDSIIVWGAIISSVMVHLALGYYLGGVLFSRQPKILVLLLALMGAALWILVLPLGYRPLFAWIAENFASVKGGAMLAINAIYFLPLCLMAMVSPFCVGSLSAASANAGFSAGKALFVSTLGAFLGTNLTSFYLIGLFPVSRIVQGIGLACFLFCLTGILVARLAVWLELKSGAQCLTDQP